MAASALKIKPRAAGKKHLEFANLAVGDKFIFVDMVERRGEAAVWVKQPDNCATALDDGTVLNRIGLTDEVIKLYL